MPDDQCTPLELKRGRACTATTARADCSTTDASSFEKETRELGIMKLLDFRMRYRGLVPHRQNGQVCSRPIRQGIRKIVKRVSDEENGHGKSRPSCRNILLLRKNKRSCSPCKWSSMINCNR